MVFGVFIGIALRTQLLLASEVVQSRFGNVTLNIPYPKNLCLIKNNGIDGHTFKIQKEAQMKQRNKLLAYWVDCDGHKKLLYSSTPVPFNEWVIVVGGLSGNPPKEKRYLQLSQNLFLKSMLKQFGDLSFNEIIKKVNKDLDRVTGKYFGEGSSIKVNDPVDLGIIGVTDSIHYGMIFSVKANVVGIDPDRIIAGVFSSALIKGVFIHYYYYMPYENKDTIKTLLSKAKYYSAKLIHAN